MSDTEIIRVDEQKMGTWDDLISPRLCLRRLRLEDAHSIYAYRSLPEVARYQGWDSYRLEDAQRLVAGQQTIVPDTTGTWLQLGITERTTGNFLGDCGLNFPYDSPDQVMIGITLSPAHQGQGLATEAMESLLTYIFGTLGKHRAFTITDAENQASANLMERTGFRKEAHHIENAWFKGAWGSEFVFAILKREWESRVLSDARSRICSR